MTREDIIRMAREVGIHVAENNSFADDLYISVLYRFAKLIAAQEREACATVCLEEAPSLDGQLCATAIRARGEK